MTNFWMSFGLYILMIILWPSTSPTDGILTFGICLLLMSLFVVVDGLRAINNNLEKLIELKTKGKYHE